MTFPLPRSRSLSGRWTRADALTTRLGSWRRGLTVVLGLIWLLDAGLQFQPYMFSRSFVTQIIEPTASGNPTVVKSSLLWSAHLMLHHLVLYNAAFAVIQLMLAIGILWPRTTRPALAASILWAVGVWWFGEGLGGILASPTSVPFMGAPGAVILYAFIAVLVWPRDRRSARGASVATSSPLGPLVPRLGWLALWGSFVYAVLVPANRAPTALSGMVAGMASGQPGWIKALDSNIASTVAGHGLAVAVVTAVCCALVGLGVFVSAPARPAVALAVVLGLAFWVTENFGGIFTGQGTDPNSGLLLVLLALVFWPLGAAGAGSAGPGERPLGSR